MTEGEWEGKGRVNMIKTKRYPSVHWALLTLRFHEVETEDHIIYPHHRLLLQLRPRSNFLIL